MIHFGSFYKFPLFILFCGLQGCQYFGVGIIYLIIYVICGGFVCPQELSAHLKLSRRTLQEYRKPIIDGKIRDDRYT